MKPCPNKKCRSTACLSTSKYVHCTLCQCRGPSGKSRKEGIKLWDALPREEWTHFEDAMPKLGDTIEMMDTNGYGFVVTEGHLDFIRGGVNAWSHWRRIIDVPIDGSLTLSKSTCEDTRV